jgi:hypothetical protein
MRRLATLGLLILVGAGGGCAGFDEWDEPEHTADYRRGGYQRDERPADRSADDGPGVYADR